MASKEMAEYVDMDIVNLSWTNICELKKAMDVCHNIIQIHNNVLWD